ncbi:MAG: C25 family cysteine peptidase, partial [Chloroflexota bacterium]
DWLEFYGVAATSEFTEQNVYWLTDRGSPGSRMATRDVSPVGNGPTPTAFYKNQHQEENHIYWQQLPNGSGQDHWFWERFESAPDSSNYTFNLPNVAAIAENGQLQVAMHGRTSTVQNPDHHVQLFLNGTFVDDVWWDGQVAITHTVVVSQSLFRSGINTLTVSTPGDTGASVDSLYFNHFSIDYWNSYIATDDQLYFSAPQAISTTFVISQFTSSTIDLYDISNPAQPQRLLNGQVSGGTLQFAEDAPLNARYLALSSVKKRTPAGMVLETASNWKSPINNANYLIITHEDLTAPATQLANHRATNPDLTVAVVQVVDIYDEFSEGLFTPHAIRDFLTYAYHNWALAPEYVLLMGDANYDYKDYLGTGSPNHIPTYLFESPVIGQTPTDNWFVTVSGSDPLPDMFLGRISVQTLNQANFVVEKILSYEQNPTPTAWQQEALFIADDDANFITISESLIAELPAGYTPQRIYGSDYQQALDSTSDILQAIDQSTLLVNFVGHGSTTGWHWKDNGFPRIFENSDITTLNNSTYPFLVTGNCSNGLFAHPETAVSFAEKFVHADQQGGIAAWSPSGLGYPFWHEDMLAALYQQIFTQGNYQLGPATTAAKI